MKKILKKIALSITAAAWIPLLKAIILTGLQLYRSVHPVVVG